MTYREKLCQQHHRQSASFGLLSVICKSLTAVGSYVQNPPQNLSIIFFNDKCTNFQHCPIVLFPLATKYSLAFYYDNIARYLEGTDSSSPFPSNHARLKRRD